MREKVAIPNVIMFQTIWCFLTMERQNQLRSCLLYFSHVGPAFLTSYNIHSRIGNQEIWDARSSWESPVEKPWHVFTTMFHKGWGKVGGLQQQIKCELFSLFICMVFFHAYLHLSREICWLDGQYDWAGCPVCTLWYLQCSPEVPEPTIHVP